MTLRGLTINGQGGSVGIHFAQGSRLDIDGCNVGNMGAQGILIDGAGTISIANTTVIGNTGVGIEVNSAAVVDHRRQSSSSRTAVTASRRKAARA